MYQHHKKTIPCRNGETVQGRRLFVLCSSSGRGDGPKTLAYNVYGSTLNIYVTM